MVSLPLSNVSLGTANFLAYVMIILVSSFLISGLLVSYYFWRKTKRMRAVPPDSPSPSP